MRRRWTLLALCCAVCWALAACGSSPPAANAQSAAAARGAVPAACSEQQVEASLRPTREEEVARALHDRGLPAQLVGVARGYELALGACPRHPSRGAWLERLASVRAHTKDEAAEVHALRSLVCENRHPFAGPLQRAESRTAAFDDPYAGCVAAEREPLDDPARKRLFDAWMRIGGYEADGEAPPDGFSSQRAIAAFRHAAGVATAAQRPFGELAEARILYRQERLAAAFALHARLLDEQERATGPTLYPREGGAPVGGELSREIVAELIVSAASALAAVDFDGPPPLAPTIARPDPLATTSSREEMSAMLAVTLDRIDDPRLLPADREWAAAVAMQVAHLFSDLHLASLSSQAYAILNRRWPLYRYRPAALFEQASFATATDPSPAATSELERTISPGSAWMQRYAADPEAQELARRYRR